MKVNWKWVFLLIPCVSVLAAGNRFIVPAGTNTSDVMVTHFPNLLFLQQSIFENHTIPLWSPLILSGYPFAANPLSTLWYPPAWLALLFPLPLGINIVTALHIFIGCSGMLFFLKQHSLNETSIWLGAVIYGLLPATFSRVTGGHFTWICASAWLPWLLFSCQWKSPRPLNVVLLKGVLIGLIILADLRFAVYSLILWFFYEIHLFSFISFRTATNKIYLIGNYFFSLLIGFSVSAVVWLPLIEFARLSTRSLLSKNALIFLSLPLPGILGLILPTQPQSIEWVIYLGVGLVILASYSIFLFRNYSKVCFWLGVALVLLLWSLGEAFYPNTWLVILPGINLLRVPARGMFFFSIAILIVGMIALDSLTSRKILRIKIFRLGVMSIAGLTVMLQMGVFIYGGSEKTILVFHSFLTIIIALGLLMFSYNKIPANCFLWLFSCTLVFDLIVVNISLTNYIPSVAPLQVGFEEAAYLKSKSTTFRVFSPSYSIPQQTASIMHLESVDGVDPLQLGDYVEFVSEGLGLSTGEYSVTLPPFRNGDPARDNEGIRVDAKQFGLLNTAYMVSAFPIQGYGWEFDKKIGDSFIYANKFSRGWAWMEEYPLEKPIPQVEIIERDVGKIIIRAHGPGRLVISEVMYPGWICFVDGSPENMQIAHSILRSVKISSGIHIVEFRFNPVSLWIGGGVSLITLLVVSILALFNRRRNAR